MKHDCNFFYGKTIFTDLRDGQQRMKYCPLCGSLLGDNNALTLKELKGLRDKPIYVICGEFPNLNGWYIVKFDRGANRINCWTHDNIRMDTINYGTWQAYLRKPIDGEGRGKCIK